MQFWSACNSFFKNTDLPPSSIELLDSSAVAYVDSDTLNFIDDYVRFILDNGESFDIKTKNLFYQKKLRAVYCYLNGKLVKITVFSDSLGRERRDYFLKNSKLVFIDGEVCCDTGGFASQSVYLRNETIYKCFINGDEITDADTMNLVAKLSLYDLALHDTILKK